MSTGEQNASTLVSQVSGSKAPTNIVTGRDNSASQSSQPATIGAFCDGNPELRHDGVTITAVTPGGPTDQAGIKAGDVILAINDRYLFTIRELQEEVGHHAPGTTITVRYRRYTAINEASIVVGRVQ
jgi:putative serine protease PepD